MTIDDSCGVDAGRLGCIDGACLFSSIDGVNEFGLVRV